MFQGLMPTTSSTTPTSTDSNAKRNSTPNGDPPKKRCIPDGEGDLLVGALMVGSWRIVVTTELADLRPSKADFPTSGGLRNLPGTVRISIADTESRIGPRPRPFLSLRL